MFALFMRAIRERVQFYLSSLFHSYSTKQLKIFGYSFYRCHFRVTLQANLCKVSPTILRVCHFKTNLKYLRPAYKTAMVRCTYARSVSSLPFPFGPKLATSRDHFLKSIYNDIVSLLFCRQEKLFRETIKTKIFSYLPPPPLSIYLSLLLPFSL